MELEKLGFLLSVWVRVGSEARQLCRAPSAPPTV